MKRLNISILLVLMLLAGMASGQYAQNALGIRFSGDDEGDGIGAEISYQRALGDGHRGELNLGIRETEWVDNYKITGIYQWVMPLEKGFNWYVGPSIGLGIIDFDRKWPRYRDDYSTLYLALGGDIGIEYIFAEVPIQLALDLRPEIYVGEELYDDFDIDLGFAIRYQFQ